MFHLIYTIMVRFKTLDVILNRYTIKLRKNTKSEMKLSPEEIELLYFSHKVVLI